MFPFSYKYFLSWKNPGENYQNTTFVPLLGVRIDLDPVVDNAKGLATLPESLGFRDKFLFSFSFIFLPIILQSWTVICWISNLESGTSRVLTSIMFLPLISLWPALQESTITADTRSS